MRCIGGGSGAICNDDEEYDIEVSMSFFFFVDQNDEKDEHHTWKMKIYIQNITNIGC